MFPVPILRGDAEQIRAIRETLSGVDYQDVIVVDFSDVAQCCKNYGEYIGKAAQADESEWRYFGLGLCGPKKLVSRLTRKYAAAAMRALVSLQMQGMPRAFEAFPAIFHMAIWSQDVFPKER